MRAAEIQSYGGSDVMKTVSDAAKPTIGPDEVLVAVHAAGINPFDWKIREGLVRKMRELSFPAILGGDFAGTIAEVGSNIKNLQPGAAVYGMADPLGNHGSFAEFTPVKASSLSTKPIKVDFIQAAALPLASVSAYKALIEHTNLQSGQKVLIHGGAGGIGSFAIQIAKHLGAYVATTAATDEVDYVKERGADEVIDYTSQQFETILKDYDAIYDTVGGEVNKRSYQVLKSGGILVSMVAQPDEALAKQYNVKAINEFTQVTTERLTKITELVDQGILTVHVDKTFPLEQAADALAYLQSGKHRGKVVITIKT
ncbi:MAG TPA: NADP-dependent oxidoreductase [Candidatus Saccharimonadales bacterium]|nr:NADP-dependent oxidoreductase [Candidatus Saccharimonadales bacterium]